MDNLHRLEEIFSHFPGIGPRQARRFVYYLLTRSPSYIKEFLQLIEDVKQSTSECDQCHRFYLRHQRSDFRYQVSGIRYPVSDICPTCSDPHRDKSTLMIVARDSDYESIEKSGAYNGLYFILGGTVPILDKEPEKRIRLEKLLKHVSDSANLKEIILSLNTTPEGEHTAEIIREALASLLNGKPVKVSILGRGLSTGAELEYVDSETIKSALKNRN
jgi:recombination protein RecR